MKKQQGFIFLITLIITGLMSSLVLTSLQQVLLYYKAVKKQKEIQYKREQLEALALKLAKKRFINPSCSSTEDEANQVLHRLFHLRGCSLRQEEQEYLYFIENLGVFPCLVVQVHGQKYASYHRRVSVLLKEQGTVLQIRFISPGPVAACLQQEKRIALGISSWRYLQSLESRTT